MDHGDQTSGREIGEPHPDHGRRFQSLVQSISVNGNGRAFCSTFRKRWKIFSGSATIIKTFTVEPRFFYQQIRVHVIENHPFLLNLSSNL